MNDSRETNDNDRDRRQQGDQVAGVPVVVVQATDKPRSQGKYERHGAMPGGKP
jgi:hypothetical protein